jgi:hypothetical protein
MGRKLKNFQVIKLKNIIYSGGMLSVNIPLTALCYVMFVLFDSIFSYNLQKVANDYRLL